MGTTKHVYEEADFCIEYLTEALKGHVQANQVYTPFNRVDYDRLAKEFGVNSGTLRRIYTGTASSPSWPTWKKIMEKLGKRVVVVE